MSKNVTLYNILISCPGDIKSEISIIGEAIEQFNTSFSETLGITLLTKHWSKSSYPESGDKPQTLLNEQIVNKCDAAIAIFWTRFGSPTDEYGSGTEEEIDIMLNSGKQVFMYFSDKPIAPSEQDSDGYKKVKAFKDKYSDKGIYFTYSSDEEFKKLLFAHLTQYFLGKKSIKEAESERVSQLKLLGIDSDGLLAENASVQKFILNSECNMYQYVDNIRSMYHEIAGISLVKENTLNTSLFPSMMTPVEIDKIEKQYLIDVAKELELGLPDDFFDLGNLERNSIPTGFMGGPDLKGTADEKKKYWLIKKLHETISKSLEWAPIEKAFSDKKCIKIALQNYGKSIDEDVEITLEIPKNVLLTLNEFPQFNNAQKGYLLNDCSMIELFGIDSTAGYFDFSESERNRSYYDRNYSHSLPGITPDYDDDYWGELSDVFCYSIYPSGENYVVKIKFDYIKHNTTVAFPTALIIKDSVAEIPYKITSKHNPDVFEGTLKVIED